MRPDVKRPRGRRTAAAWKSRFISEIANGAERWVSCDEFAKWSGQSAPFALRVPFAPSPFASIAGRATAAWHLLS